MTKVLRHHQNIVFKTTNQLFGKKFFHIYEDQVNHISEAVNSYRKGDNGTMTNPKWTQQRDDFFVEVLKREFLKWKEKDKGNTQGEFARQICEIRKKKTGEKCPVTNSYVSEWLRGKWFPEQYIPEIAEVLGVEEEVFFFRTHDEIYRLSSENATEWARGEISQFCDEIGLDRHFLRIIRELFGSDFDEMFPTWTEIIQNPNFLDNQTYIRRKPASWSIQAEMDEDVRFLQYEIDDGKGGKKLIPFTREDLRFLKDVQTDVVDRVEYLMMKRKKDLQREAEEATRRSQHNMKNGGIAFKPLTIEELNQIDKYHDYHYQYTSQKDGDK